MASVHRCDVAIVGAGLAGGLIALALAKRHPELDIRLIDAAPTIGGNHLWSFFGSDVATANRWILEPLVCHAWTGYDVAFPAHQRTIDATYYSIESERLDEVVRRELPPQALMLGRKVLGASPRAALFFDGDRVEANGVIDARGPGDLSCLDVGWQKFVGRELKLSEDYARTRPVIMDARVEQIDGYRFVYTLPLAKDRIFVEDTYYSDTPDLDAETIAGRVHDYAEAQGWAVGQATREESGVLPVVLDGDFDAYWRSGGAKVAKAGMRSGLFHPTTGYSLPDAVRVAAMLAARKDFSGAGLHDATYRMAKRAWGARGFYRMLDTMLFRVAEPEERYRVLQRFYTLAPGLIGRFYAGESTMIDKARVLTGKPPVPFWRAVGVVAGVVK